MPEGMTRSAGVRSWTPERVDRAAWAVLAVAGAVSAALLLRLNDGGIFFFDELRWFSDLGGENDLESVLMPHNSHLHGTIRALYLLTMETIGTEYLVFRILGVIAVLLCAGLFFALAKRRIGTLPALVPAILLLFYGAAWQHVVVPIGFTPLFSIAAGLGALLAIEREDRRGDLIACALVCLSVFTFTVGLGFLVGVAISVLLRSDRLRRAWVFAVPLALYVTWWVWARQFDQTRTDASNVDAIVPFVSDSLNVVTGSLTGVNIPFARGDELPVSFLSTSVLGWVTAAALAILVAWRISRGSVPRSLWVSLGVLGTYWLAGALATPLASGPQAEAVRYLFPGTIGVLLVATDAARGIRFGRAGLAALIAVGAFSLAMNGLYLRDGAAYYTDDYSPRTKAQLTMFELGSGLDPGGGGGEPLVDTREILPPGFGVTAFDRGADGYLLAVQRYGSPALTLDELRGETPVVQQEADVWLAVSYELALEPSGGPDRIRGCRTVSAGEEIELAPGGAALRVAGPEPSTVHVRRFGEPPGHPVGTLEPGPWSELRIPRDGAPEPWSASAESADMTACPLGAG